MKKLKYLIWRLNNSTKCPYCKKELLVHGFEPNERYTCENKKCEFGKNDN